MSSSWQLEDKHNERPTTGYWRPTEKPLDSLVQRYDTGSNRNYSSGNDSFTSHLTINLKPSDSRRSSVAPIAQNRCDKCSEEIDREKSSEIKFSGRSFHQECFACSVCQKTLDVSTLTKFGSTSNGEPICLDCEESGAKTCFQCSRRIIREKSIIFDEKFYHRDCFACSICKIPLAEETNIYKHESRACCLKCANENFAPRCAECSQPIGPGKLTVFDSKKFHVECFRCGQCDTIMNDSTFYTHQGKPCCNRCFNESFAERCAACSKIIHTGKTILYDSKHFHSDCFRCVSCSQVISERQFHTRDGQPCCDACFETRFAEICASCRKIIKGISTKFDEKNFHPECLTCGQCFKTMNQSQFHVHQGKPFCDECFSKMFGKFCAFCQKSIEKNSKIFREKIFHPECFRCGQCSRPMEEEQFHVEQDKPCCNSCFQRKFAKFCALCLKLIETKSTIFNEKAYHPECFRCGQCWKSLNGGEKSFVFESKPCCDRCFYDRAASKCFVCSLPIIEKFTNFNGNKYHLDCFRCSNCSRVIAPNQTFVQRLNQIFCSNCPA